MISADRNFTDIVLSINGEKMAQRERAELAEARVAELEEELAESQRLVEVADKHIEHLGRLLAEAKSGTGSG